VSPRAGGIHAPGEEAGKFALVHVVKNLEPGIVGPVVELGQSGIGLFEAHVHSVHGPQEACRIFRKILPPVEGILFLGFGCPLFVVRFQRRKRCRRRSQIAGPDVE